MPTGTRREFIFFLDHVVG